MLKNLSIRAKLLAIVFMVAASFVATSLTVGRVARHQIVELMQAEMERATQVTAEFVLSRFERLDAGLHSMVETPEIRAVLTTPGIDHETQLMSITDLQHLIDADLVIYCDQNGVTLARTDDPFDQSANFSQQPLVARALQGEMAKGFWELDGGHVQMLAIAYPIQLEGDIKGVVVAGKMIQNEGTLLRSLLMREVILARNDHVLLSSLPFPVLEETKLAHPASVPLISSITSADDVERIPTTTVVTNSEATLVMEMNVEVLAETFPGMRAMVLVPESSVFGFYRQFNRMLWFAASSGLAAAILLTTWIGVFITEEVRGTLSVLERVAQGDLTARSQIRGRDEFGRMGIALNTAIEAAAATVDVLAQRNRDTRTLLDSVEQGFFTVDSKGVMSDEHSGAVERMLGVPAPGMRLADFISQFDARTGMWIELGLEDVFGGLLPMEVTLDQMPRRFQAHGRVFSINYTPLLAAGELEGLAVVLSDITLSVENEKLEAAQREMLVLAQRAADDRPGFIEFFKEADVIVDGLRRDQRGDLAIVQRRIHTLKGNVSIFGLDRLTSLCHEIETHIVDNDELPPPAKWTELLGAWAATRGNARRLLGDQGDAIPISSQELDDVMGMIGGGCQTEDIAIEVSRWRLESTATRLRRVAEQARGLARRLGKGEISARIESHGLFTDAAEWSEFWASFVHVVRNAVDHGLESPEDRRLSGKSEVGTIVISTSIEVDQYVISIRDDGRGIAWERLAAKASAAGLPAESREDLINALFTDGLSTTEEISETSGRGVGMGAVREVCQSRGGTIEIETERGTGTSFVFRFPIQTMARRVVDELRSVGVAEPLRVIRLDTDGSTGKLNPQSKSVGKDVSRQDQINSIASREL